MSHYAVINPSTGQQLRTYPTTTDAELDTVLNAARDTYEEWGRGTAVADRSLLLSRVAALHLERRDDLASIIQREMGKPLDAAHVEVNFAADIYAYYATHSSEFLADEPIRLLGGSGTAVVQRRPLGPLLGIMPWNYPYYQVARFAAPNFAVGNTIVLKHAPQCPESSTAIAQIFLDAGFPVGAYSNVYATNEQVEGLIADPRIQGVSLTGSEAAGSAVAATAGRHLKKCVLELGGSDPFLVLGSDDLHAAVAAAVDARLENGGQACNAAKRFIIVDDLYDEFVDLFTAAILAAPRVTLSSAAAAERLERQVERAVADGAHAVLAGQRQGASFPTGVLLDVDAACATSQEELFGPIAMVFRAVDEEDAVRLANDTPYGLGSYVFTNDPEQASRVADRIDAGMVFINCVGAESAELPFGGIKRSGYGRELGRYGLDEFVNRKLVRTGA